MVDMASACLAGVSCRYDAKPRTDPHIQELFLKGEILPFCPEVLGGLGIPRAAMRIEGGSGADVLEKRVKVVNEKGEDCTADMIKGAEKTLALVKTLKPSKIYLKGGSPSCGFSEEGITGVTAAALQRENLNLINIE